MIGIHCWVPVQNCQSRSSQVPTLLAVDSRNTPAREIYGSLGFREIARRAAHVRIARRR